MRSLSKPTTSAGEAFALCVGEYPDSDLKDRLAGVAPTIEQAGAKYEELGSNLEFYKIVATDDVDGKVTIREMKELYSSKLVQKPVPRRQIYEAIMTLPARGICPLCGQRFVSTLDHYLPKSEHPALAVLPLNLVPACADCNKSKLTKAPTTARQQTFHPYYDKFGTERWLYARVLKSSPPALEFIVRPPSNWSAILAARARWHLKVFQLRKLFASHAAEELVCIRHSLLMIHQSAGASGVHDHLAEQAKSREAAQPNSWQTATYAALSASGWFCDVGVQLIPAV